MGYLTLTPQSSVGQEAVVCFLYPSLVSSCMTGLPSYVEWLSRRMTQDRTRHRGGAAHTIMNDVSQYSNELSTRSNSLTAGWCCVLLCSLQDNESFFAFLKPPAASQSTI